MIFKKLAPYIYSKKSLIFFERPTGKDGATYDAPLSGISKELPLNEVDSLAEILLLQTLREDKFKPVFDVRGAFERIKNGELCVVYENQGRISGYGWFAPGTRYIPEIKYELRLSDDEFYCYNGYVVREYRGANIIDSIITTACSLFHARGGRRAITGYLDWNKASAKVARKLGFNPLGSVTVWYLMTLRFTVNRCREIDLRDRGGLFDFYRTAFSYAKLLTKPAPR